jgi:two-component system, sensor histidine kinase and response regulator
MADKKINILLVDDSEYSLVVLKKHLEPLGLKMVSVLSAKEAILMTLEHEFALIISDVNMPDINGFELCSLLRDDDRTRDIPVILISGEQLEEKDMIKGFESGALEYLLKPVNQELLRGKVTRFVELYEKTKLISIYQHKLKRSEEDLDQFAFIIANDLKAPLWRTNLMLSWLINGYEDQFSPEVSEIIGDITSQQSNMKKLVEGILDFTKISGEEEALFPEDINDIVDDVITVLGPIRKISVTKDGDFPFLVITKSHIHQIFQNLIGNALRHVDQETGKIVVKGESMPDVWQFSVKDDGEGIPDKLLEKIFNVFEAFDENNDGVGLGIGLYTVKKIVEKYHGRVWVESKVGKGSTFFFTLSKSSVEKEL